MSDSKRRLSSDGKTPKPVAKSVKMAEGGSKGNTGSSHGDGESEEPDIVDRFTIIAKAIDRLQKGQSSLQSMIESKLDKFRNDFMSSIDEKFKAMKTDIDLELAIHKNEIDILSRSIDSIVNRLENVEQVAWPSPENVNTAKCPINPLDDPSVTLIATNVKCDREEEILDVAREIIGHLDDNANVVAACRLKNRGNRPGLVKISVSSLTEKKAVLREKRKLREIEKFKTVFLRSSKTHTERLIELNARTILNEMPHGKQFRITANGRIVKKQPQVEQINDVLSDHEDE